MATPPDDDGFPADTFLAPMPWWVVCERRPPSPDPGSPDLLCDPTPIGEALLAEPLGYLVIDSEDCTCLAVFTDEDLAERFTRTAGFDGHPLQAATPSRFLNLCQTLPPICTYVAFDPPPTLGGRARWVVSLSKVRQALQFLHDDAATG